MSTPILTPSPARSQSLVRRHPLISFFVLTYAVTWTLWAPLVIFRDQIPGPLAFVLLVLGSNVPSVLGVLFVAADPAYAHCSDARSTPGSDCSGTWPLSRSRYLPYAPYG